MPDGRSRWPAPGDRSLLAVAFAVVLTRLPFLGVGYGTDNDAWTMAAASRHIALTGEYKVSRFPGFPIPEYAGSLLWRGGPWLVNGMSAVMCAAAAVLLAMILRRAGARDAALGAATFAFVPAVYIGSVSGMDYLWACAFLMAAFVLALERRGALAGLALGLAAGCRITSIAFLAPLALMRVMTGPPGRGRAVLAMTLTALAVACAAFVPVYRQYGLDFLAYYEPAGGHMRTLAHFLAGFATLYRPPFPPLFVAGIATVGVWGALGFTALIVALACALARPAAKPAPAVPRGLFAACGLAALVSAILFLRLPDDEGYLIPAVPFVLILLAHACERRVFRVLCVALLASPFLLGVDVAPPKKGVSPASRSALSHDFRLGGRETFVLDPLRGPLLMDFAKRRAQMEILARARARWPGLPANTVVVAGLLDLPLHIEIGFGPVSTFDVLTLDDLRRFVQQGRPVLYFPDAPERTARFLHYSLEAEGARPFFAAAR